MPCMELLKAQLLERARIEVEMFIGCYRPGPGATHYDFVAGGHLSIFRDALGLMAYDPVIVKSTSRSPV